MLKLIFRCRNTVLGVVIILVISFAMLGFGVDFFNAPSGEDYAIKINDQEISNYEYNSAKNNYVDSLKSRFGQMYEQIKSLINIEQQIKDQLVDQALLTQFAKKIGFSAGNEEVALRIQELFPTDTIQSYNTYLKRTGQNPKDFDNVLRDALINESYQNILSDLLYVSEKEVVSKIIKDRETFNINYVAVDVDSFNAKNEPTEEELLEFYNGVAVDFEEKEKVAYEFATFDPKDFKNTIVPDENEVELYYSENIDKFTTPEKILAKIIKMPSSIGEKKASEVAERAKKGEDFAKLMKEFSSEKNENAEKWYTRGVLDIAVEEVLFNGKSEGLPKFFDMIKTKDYYYIPYVLKYQSEDVKPLTQVENEIKNDIIISLAPAFAKDKAESIKALLEQGKEVTEPILWNQVALSSKGTFPENFAGLTDKILENPSEKFAVFEFNNVQVLVKVTNYQESKILDFDSLGEKKNNLIKLYKEKKAKELSETFANGIIKDLEVVSLIDEAKEKKLTLETFKNFSKENQSEGLMGIPAIRDMLLTLNKKGDYSKSFVLNDKKLYIFQVADVVEGSNDVKESDILEKFDNAREVQRELAIKNILNVLKSNSDIKFGRNIDF